MKSFFEDVHISTGLGVDELEKVVMDNALEVWSKKMSKDIESSDQPVVEKIDRTVTIKRLEYYANYISGSTKLAWSGTDFKSEVNSVRWDKGDRNIHAKAYMEDGVCVVACNGYIRDKARIFAGYCGLMAHELGYVKKIGRVHITKDSYKSAMGKAIADAVVKLLLPDEYLELLNGLDYPNVKLCEQLIIENTPLPDKIIHDTLSDYYSGRDSLLSKHRLDEFKKEYNELNTLKS